MYCALQPTGLTPRKGLHADPAISRELRLLPWRIAFASHPLGPLHFQLGGNLKFRVTVVCISVG